MTVHGQRRVSYRGLFGRMEVHSSCLYDPRTGRPSRPVQDAVDIGVASNSRPLARPLSDFGIEDSSRPAAERREEHYSWPLERYCVRRATQKAARDAYAWEESLLA